MTSFRFSEKVFVLLVKVRIEN